MIILNQTVMVSQKLKERLLKTNPNVDYYLIKIDQKQFTILKKFGYLIHLQMEIKLKICTILI